MARGHGHCGEIRYGGSNRWRCGCRGERSNTMKNLTRAKIAAMTMAAIMTVAATSCHSEEERRDEELRNERGQAKGSR